MTPPDLQARAERIVEEWDATQYPEYDKGNQTGDKCLSRTGLIELITTALAEEREACARVAQQYTLNYERCGSCMDCRCECPEEIATAIRQRGKGR